MDSSYLYIMEEYCHEVFEQYASAETDYELGPELEIKDFQKNSGFTAINFNGLFRSKFSEIWVCNAATGHNSTINISWTDDTLSLIKNIHSIAVMPMPHWNLISFVGMGSKSKYLIWKNSLDGFFTAVNNQGEIRTWSTYTG